MGSKLVGVTGNLLLRRIVLFDASNIVIAVVVSVKVMDTEVNFL
jgi:hypothetical protein